MKKPILLLSMLLCSCGSGLPSGSSLSSSSSGNPSPPDISSIRIEGTNLLPAPKEVIQSFDDVVYALDYMAFYRVDEKVTFQVDAKYAETLYSFEPILRKAYLTSDLADVYPVVFSSSKQTLTFTVDFSISKDVASNPPEVVPSCPFYKEHDFKEDYASDLEFAFESGKATCATSEQLFYAVTHHYEPDCVAGSAAARIYEEAKSILSSIIDPSFDAFDKIKAVYDYLTSNIYYDSETAYSSDTYLVGEQAYYLEGVFFNECAVCDGKAKAYSMLLQMLGIECYRQAGTNELGYDHAWNIVHYDDEYYISCVTYGSPSPKEILGEEAIIPSYNMMLQDIETPYGEEWGYESHKHQDIVLSETPFDVFGHMGRRVKDYDGFLALTFDLELSSHQKYAFCYDGENRESFEKSIIGLAQSKEWDIVTSPYNDGAIYQLIRK